MKTLLNKVCFEILEEILTLVTLYISSLGIFKVLFVPSFSEFPSNMSW